jgi:hypothetical protein
MTSLFVWQEQVGNLMKHTYLLSLTLWGTWLEDSAGGWGKLQDESWRVIMKFLVCGVDRLMVR